MQVSSKLQSSADRCPSAPVLVQAIKADAGRVSLDEFPQSSQREYDWMLQPASQFKPDPVTRVLAVVVTILFVAFTIFLIDKL